MNVKRLHVVLFGSIFLLNVASLNAQDGVAAGTPNALTESESVEPKTATLARNLESFKVPVQRKVGACSRELQLASKAAREASQRRNAVFNELMLTKCRLEKSISILKAMCSATCINGAEYSKEDVAETVKAFFAEYRAAEEALVLREKTVEIRNAVLAKTELKVAKWRKAERELLQQISLLRAQHDLFLAEKQVARPISEPQIVQSERLLSEISAMFPNRETQKAMVVAKPVPGPTEGARAVNDSLLNEIDAIIEAGEEDQKVN